MAKPYHDAPQIRTAQCSKCPRWLDYDLPKRGPSGWVRRGGDWVCNECRAKSRRAK